MFTALITLFLTVLGALRASPLYAGVLTLGNGLQVKSWFICATVLVPLLYDKASILTSTSLGNGFSYALPLVLSLPAPPLLLTLPSGISDDDHTHHLYYSLTLILLVIGSLACTLWYLRTTYLVDPVVDNRLGLTLNDPTFGNPYTGNTFEASSQLAGVLDHFSMVTTNEASTSPSGDFAVRPPQKHQKSKHRSKSKVTVVPSPSPSPITPAARIEHSTALPSVDASSGPTPAPLNNDDDGDWKTWTNKRQRRLSKRAPPPPTRSQRRAHSRSSSTLSSSYTSDSLFSTTSTASTAPTSVASSRRSSFATSLPPKPSSPSPFIWTKPRPPPSIVSYNRFSVLEVE
ncbi:hypothetical protein C8Q78DRAFT_1028740 [Trametes maxima]|nr:hypothetical protein C8Q78DRAFT_1028740 [Trametes maxima]